MQHIYDVIIIGSGAGGSAAAYHLTQLGLSVLLIERGPALPKDGSTLSVDKVVKQGAFKYPELWLDRDGNTVLPGEFANLGGKTKWYGAALLRYAPEEFAGDETHRFLPWPIRFEDLEPFYAEAERLLAVRQFPVEPGLARIISGLRRLDANWREGRLPIGLSPDIFDHPHEARHFDGFASARGLKSDGETSFLDRVRAHPNLRVMTGNAVTALIQAPGRPERILGVACADGSRFEGDVVLLAAGALHSPRLLQQYLEATRLAERLPAYRNVGRNYKSHVLTWLIAFSARPVEDVLRKTALLLSDEFPCSSVQNTGFIDGELIGAEAPRWLPAWGANFLGRRAYGFFLQTEDGSHPDNRVIPARNGTQRPVIDYDLARLPEAQREHRRLTRRLVREFLRLGCLPVVKPVGVTGTAHACGTLAAGSDPAASVVDANGRVHGLDNLYVVDGSVLPRSSRVNPALTICAWALRVASRLTSKQTVHAGAATSAVQEFGVLDGYQTAGTDPVRA